MPGTGEQLCIDSAVVLYYSLQILLLSTSQPLPASLLTHDVVRHPLELLVLAFNSLCLLKSIFLRHWIRILVE
jgi:hypothetical protein